MNLFSLYKYVSRPVVLCVLISCGVHAGEALRIEKISDTAWRIDLNIPAAEISETESEGVFYSVINPRADLPFISNAESPTPYLSFPLHLSSRQAELKIVSSSETRLTLAHPLAPAGDVAIAPDTVLSNKNVHSKSLPLSPPTPAQLRYQGDFRGNHLWSLLVYPFQPAQQPTQLVFINKLTIDIVQGREQGTTNLPQDERQLIQSIATISATDQKSQSKKPSLYKTSALISDKWKIQVSRDGIYKLTGTYLSASGVRLLDIDINTLKLTLNGKEVPIFVKGWQDGRFDKNDYIEFWGEQRKKTLLDKSIDIYQDTYSKVNVYWLSWGEQKGQWLVEEDGLVPSENLFRYQRPFSFYETVHIERDDYYDRLSYYKSDDLRDRWFYDSGISAAKKRAYPFDLYNPDPLSPLNVYVKVMMSGRSYDEETSQQHDVAVFLNDTYLTSQRWYDQNTAVLQTAPDAKITASELNHLGNTLMLVNQKEITSFDFVMLNWFEISYPRLYRAHQDFIKFGIPPDYDSGQFLFRIDGFEKPKVDIYKLGSSKISGVTVEEVTDFDGFTSLQASFQDYVTSKETEYVALTEEQKLVPDTMLVDTPSMLKSFFQAADYLVVTHKRFSQSPALDELVRLRQGQGYHVLKVDVQDVYDEFNHGHPSPYALKDFLRWAYDNWLPPQLKFVLFIGDGSYIRYDSKGDTLDLVPVYMRQTEKFGAAASDNWYALVDGDDELPDLHIGRLPVRTNEELEIIIKKIIAYETEPPKGDWRNRMLFIAGNGLVFRDQARELVGETPKEYDTRRLATVKDNSLDYDPFFGGTADLLDYFSDGCAIMSFHGHGGGAIWADNGLMRLEDADRIYSQGKLPLVLSMTCFTGSFESPTTGNLADALLFTAGEGAVAFFGASGVGWLNNDFYLQTEILKCLYKNPTLTVGEVLSAGKISYYTKYGSYLAKSQVNQYHLLGDPATRLVMPQEKGAIDIENQTPLPGDSLKATVQLPFANGTLYMDVVDEQFVSRASEQIDLKSAWTELILPLEENFTRQGFIRFYAYDPLALRQVHGSRAFTLDGVHFDSSRVTVADEDSLFFWIKFKRRVDINKVWCSIAGDSLAMSWQSGFWFRTTKAVARARYGYYLLYSFYVELLSGGSLKSDSFTWLLKTGVDLRVISSSIALTAAETVGLRAEITNNGDTDAERVPILFSWLDASTATWNSVGSDTVSVAASQKTWASVPFSAYAGSVDIKVIVDPDNKTGDPNVNDNTAQSAVQVNMFNYLPSRGLQTNDTFVDSMIIDNSLGVAFESRLMSTPDVLSIQRLEGIDIFEQPALQSVQGLPGYEISFAHNGSGLENPVRLKLNIPELPDSLLSDILAEMNWFVFQPRMKKWLKLPTTIHGGAIECSVRQLGRFAVLRGTDDVLPGIEVSVDGQQHVQGTFVTPKPQITISFQDANGIDFLSAKSWVSLDGRMLQKDELSLPDSVSNSNLIVLDYKPELSAGQHALQMQTADCFGNVSAVNEIQFVVSEEFDVKVLGNYPNPFRKETTFAYLLTRSSDYLAIKIYSASGRLIRTIDPRLANEDPNPSGVDYHEAVWDGKDDNGDDIANGVYFFKFIAESSGKRKEITGKLAKLK